MSFGRLEIFFGGVAKKTYELRKHSSAAEDLQTDLDGQGTSLQRNFRDKFLLTMDVLVGACMAAGIATVIYFTVR